MLLLNELEDRRCDHYVTHVSKRQFLIVTLSVAKVVNEGFFKKATDLSKL